MLDPPQNIGVQIQIPLGEGTRRGSFGGGLGHKDGSPKEARELAEFYFFHLRLQLEVCNQEDSAHPTMMDLDLEL